MKFKHCQKTWRIKWAIYFQHCTYRNKQYHFCWKTLSYATPSGCCNTIHIQILYYWTWFVSLKSLVKIMIRICIRIMEFMMFTKSVNVHKFPYFSFMRDSYGGLFFNPQHCNMKNKSLCYCMWIIIIKKSCDHVFIHFGVILKRFWEKKNVLSSVDIVKHL